MKLTREDIRKILKRNKTEDTYTVSGTITREQLQDINKYCLYSDYIIPVQAMAPPDPEVSFAVEIENYKKQNE